MTSIPLSGGSLGQAPRPNYVWRSRDPAPLIGPLAWILATSEQATHHVPPPPRSVSSAESSAWQLIQARIATCGPVRASLTWPADRVPTNDLSPPLRGYPGATAYFPERSSPQSQPCRAVQRGCFLLITNSRPRRRTRIAPSLAASDRNEFRFFMEIPFRVGSNAGSPRSARFAELDVPAHGRVVLAQHEPVGVVAPALRSHVRGTGALAANQPDDSSRTSVVGHAYLLEPLVGMVTGFNKTNKVLISLPDQGPPAPR